MIWRIVVVLIAAFVMFYGVPISGGCPQTFLPRLDVNPVHVIARFISAANNGWKQMEQGPAGVCTGEPS
jgi:hypothetical protein